MLLFNFCPLPLRFSLEIRGGNGKEGPIPPPASAWEDLMELKDGHKWSSYAVKGSTRCHVPSGYALASENHTP